MHGSAQRESRFCRDRKRRYAAQNAPAFSLLPQGGQFPRTGQGGGIFGARKHGFAVQNVPHIFFLSCQKENVPDTVQKKKR